MDRTSHSLLERLRERPSADDWNRLVELYEPWIRDWIRRQRVQEHDAADITQEVLAAVVQELPRFHYDPGQGRFRGWLRTIAVNRLRAFWKARARQAVGAADSGVEGLLDQLADPASELSRQWDREHDVYVIRRAMAAIRPEFQPTTWRAFQRVVLDARPVSEVASELGISRNAVYIAQSRVLNRLRSQVRGLCDL